MGGIGGGSNQYGAGALLGGSISRGNAAFTQPTYSWPTGQNTYNWWDYSTLNPYGYGMGSTSVPPYMLMNR